MNYRDEQILEWLKQEGTIEIKYQEVADKYNCSLITAKRIFSKFKDAGFIEIKNRKWRGIRVSIKDDLCLKN